MKEYILVISDEVLEKTWKHPEDRPQELVRCKDCMHRPADPENKKFGQYLIFPDGICQCRADDQWYSWMPNDDWFCADGERSDKS